jgi:hypothetical protein
MKMIAALTVTTVATLAILTAGAGGEPAPAAPTAPAAELDAGALAAHSLGVNSLPGMRLLASAHGRDVLARVVSCALPRGATITTITRSGTPYSFTGDAGLAPAWARRAVTPAEHRRVAACVAARTGGLIRV